MTIYTEAQTELRGTVEDRVAALEDLRARGASTDEVCRFLSSEAPYLECLRNIGDSPYPELAERYWDALWQ